MLLLGNFIFFSTRSSSKFVGSFFGLKLMNIELLFMLIILFRVYGCVCVVFLYFGLLFLFCIVLLVEIFCRYFGCFGLVYCFVKVVVVVLFVFVFVVKNFGM